MFSSCGKLLILSGNVPKPNHTYTSFFCVITCSDTVFQPMLKPPKNLCSEPHGDGSVQQTAVIQLSQRSHQRITAGKRLRCYTQTVNGTVALGGCVQHFQLLLSGLPALSRYANRTRVMKMLHATTQGHNPIDCLSVTSEGFAGSDALMRTLVQLYDNALLSRASAV